jgi:ABC-type branched-subunit amino acid transport system ATPase component
MSLTVEVPLLECRGVSRRFGGLLAVDGVNVRVTAGQIVALIGPNGAGKTTLLHLISGFVRPNQGTVELMGRRIDRLGPHQVAALGVRRTFQLEGLFPALTVAENVGIGALHARVSHDETNEILQLVGLEDWADVPANLLPYGFRRRLGVAIALAGHPKLLLLDEPAAGLNAQESTQLVALIRQVRDQGVTVVLIEHDMDVVGTLAEEIVVLDHGRVIASGPAASVLNDRTVIEVYLGRWYQETG